MARVLILGGVGFIGRNLVRYLAENNLAGKILVADKVPPMVAGLNDVEKAVFESDLVSFKQCNLARENTIDAVFEFDGGNWQYVINLCGATKYSQPEEVYEESVVDAARVASAAAVRAGVSRWIEVSTAQVYKSEYKKTPDGGWTETGTIDPWTGVARARLRAEEIIQASGLNHVIVRPSIVYGVGDTLGLTPKLVIASIYKESGKKMELLWSQSLNTNTVHVSDVAAALWHLTNHGDNGAIFNLSDSQDSTQGTINDLLIEIYGIKVGFAGQTKSNLASGMGKKKLTNYVNDQHLKPWSELCKARGIHDTPLTPYLDEELLYQAALHVNGTAITSTGFQYQHPVPTTDHLREVINDFIAKGAFPEGVA
jgi:nucleoside-diphosphate-sugar epimerase